MPNLDVIRSVTLRYVAQGAAEYAAAGERAAASSTKLAQSAGVVAVATERQERSVLSAGKALEAYARANDPVFKATQSVERAQLLLNRAVAQGYAGTEAYVAAQRALTRQQALLAGANDNATAAAKAGAAAHHGHAEGMGASAATGAELVHILKSVADETAAGVPLTRSLAVEGGRLFQVMSSGQLGGALSFVGSKLAFLANPLALGAAGMAGLGAAAYLAYRHLQDVNREMDRAVSGSGGFAGLTGRQLGDVAQRYSDEMTGGRALSAGEARSVAGSLASGSHLDADNLQRAMGLAQGYAGAFNVSIEDAGKSLSEVFSDPLRGIDKLNERLGFLNAGTRSYIETLQAQGDTQGAIRAAIDAASASLNSQAKEVTGLAKIMRDASVDAEHFRDAMGRLAFGGGKPLVPQLDITQHPSEALMEQARRSADAFRRDPEAARGGAMGFVDPVVPAAPGVDPYNDLEDARHREELRRYGEEQAARDRSDQVAGLARGVAPEFDQRKQLQDQFENLSKALADPEIVRALGDRAGVAYAALDKAGVGLATYATAADKVRQQTAFSTAAIDADDVATRTLIETQRAYATTLQATRDATQAAAEAEKVRAEAVANAQKRLDEAEQSARDQAALIGLNPYQRILEEAKQAREALERDSVIPAAKSGVGAGVGVPLGGGFDAAVNRTLGFEGGRLAADTNGTPTQFGINAANNPGVDLSTLTVDGAKGIYKTKYWDPLNLSGASPGLQRVAFDTSVMEGPARANRFISQSGGDADQFMDLRQEYEAGLLRSDPAKYGRFATSWANRDASLRLDLGKSGTMEGNAPSTAGTDPSKVFAANDDLTKARTTDLFAAPFRDAQQQLDAMRRSQTELAGGFGMTADKVAGINERLKLENDLIRSGATSLAPYGPQLDAMEQAYAKAAKAAEDLKKHNDDLVHAMNDVRASATDMLDPLIQAGLHGTSVMKALHQGLESVASLLTKRLEGSLVDSLFGASGTTGAGSPIGGPLSSLLGGGSGSGFGSYGPQLPGAGGVGLLSGIGKLFGFADGGYTGAGSKYQPAGFVHAGEYVMDAATVSRVGVSAFDAIRRGLPGYASGGYVGPMPSMPSAAQFPAAEGGGDTHIHVQVNGATGNTELHQITHAAVTSALQSYDKSLPGRLAERQRRVG